MTSLLATVGPPIVGYRLIERFERLELDAILLFVVLAYVHEVVGKLLIVFWPQIVSPCIGVASHTTAVSHVRGCRAAEEGGY